MTIMHAAPDTRRHPAAARLDELARALDREREVVEELCDTLVRQREAVASTAADAVNASVDAIGRILLTLEEARRHRAALVRTLTGDPATRLEGIEAALRVAPSAALDAARRGLRGAAAEVAREAAINRAVLARAIESGEAFLQALFSGAELTTPVYGVRETDESRPGVLLNRRA